MLIVSNLISQRDAAFKTLRLRKEFSGFANGQTPGAKITETDNAVRDQAGGRVDVFFDHRRTRSTIAMMSLDKLLTFEVRRSEAMALQTRLANSPRERAHALAEFVERWRQQ